MQPPYVISLQWLDEIIAAITNFFGEKAAAFAKALDLAALFTWIKDHAVFILGAILMALWLLGTFKK
jgi:hypothetical protein